MPRSNAATAAKTAPAESKTGPQTLGPRALIQVPLSRLSRSPTNARRTEATEQWPLDELVSSIRFGGVLTSLLVRPNAKSKSDYEVVAGGRRLQALQQLAKEGHIDSDYKVPCIVCKRLEDVAALEYSLMENTARLSMSITDEWRAFAKLIDEGQSTDEIAVRFGCSPRRVKQRLRLGTIIPEVLEAFEAKTITYAIVQAFAKTDDNARQRAVWDAIKDQAYINAYMIENALTEDCIYATSPLVTFVTLEAYRAAGGATVEDLFAADEAHIEIRDIDLLTRLATDKLETLAKDISDTWAWVKIVPTTDLTTQGYRHAVKPHPAVRDNSALVDAAAAAEDRYYEADERADANPDDPALYSAVLDADWAHHLALSRLAASVHTDAQLKVTGALISINRNGWPQITSSLIDEAIDDPYWAEQAAANATNPSTGAPATNGATAPNGAATNGAPGTMADPAVPTRPTYTRDLSADLRATRNTLVKTALAQNYSLAFDLTLYALMNPREHQYYSSTGSTITARHTEDAVADQPPNRKHGDPVALTPAAELLDRVTARLNPIATDDADPEPLDDEQDEHDNAAVRDFETLSALPLADKKALFAHAVARSLMGQLSTDPIVRPMYEHVVSRLNPPMARQLASLSQPIWTAPFLWSRMTRAQMLAVGRETLGEDWYAAHAKLKKVALCAVMEHAFNPATRDLENVSKSALRTARAWLPEGLAPQRDPAPSDTAVTGKEESATNGAKTDPAPETSESQDQPPVAAPGAKADLPDFLATAAH